MQIILYDVVVSCIDLFMIFSNYDFMWLLEFNIILHILLLVGCTNEFVKLKYDPSDSTISCRFLTQPVVSERSCSVKYRKCQEKPTHDQLFSMANGTVNPIALTLSLTEGTYCFEVTASNSDFSVMIMGNISKSLICFLFCVAILWPAIYIISAVTVPASGVINSMIIGITVSIIIIIVLIVIFVPVLTAFMITLIVRRKHLSEGTLCINIIGIFISIECTNVNTEFDTNAELKNMVEEHKDEDIKPIISHKQFSIIWNPDSENLQQFYNKHKFPSDIVFLKYDKLRIQRSDVRDVIVLKKNEHVSS